MGAHSECTTQGTRQCTPSTMKVYTTLQCALVGCRPDMVSTHQALHHSRFSRKRRRGVIADESVAVTLEERPQQREGRLLKVNAERPVPRHHLPATPKRPIRMIGTGFVHLSDIQHEIIEFNDRFLALQSSLQSQKENK